MNSATSDDGLGKESALLLSRSTQTCDVIAVNNSGCSPYAVKVTSLTESPAESMSFRFDSDYDNDKDKADMSELLQCGACGAQLSMRDATVGRYRTLRELTSQPSDDVIQSHYLHAAESSSLLRHESATTDATAAKVNTAVSTSEEAKRRVDASEVLSALGALLSDQLTCSRCANQPQSPCAPPHASQVPNQNVPTPTLRSAAPLANNSEPNSGAGELMRYILHDVKKVKTAIIRQTATRRVGSTDKQHRQKDARRRRTRLQTPVSDDSNDDDNANDNDNNINDECRQSKGRHVRYETSQFRLPAETGRDYPMSGAVRSKYDDDDGRLSGGGGRSVMYRAERCRCMTTDSLQLPTTPRRFSIRNDSMQVNKSNGDSSAWTWSPPREEYRLRHEPSEQFMTGPQSAHYNAYDQPLPPYQRSYQQCFRQQQQHQHPQESQQQFQHQKPLQTPPYLHQTPQPAQPSFIKPIHQVSPPAAQRQPLVFIPIRNHHQQQKQRRRQQQQDSPDVATRLGKFVHWQSQPLRDAVKLAKQIRNLTAQIYKRQQEAQLSLG